MPRHPGLSQWQHTVSTYLPELSQPQRTVLALWSLGIVLAQSCGLTTVAVLLPVTEQAPVPQQCSKRAPQQGRGERLLVVEDEPAMREVTRRILVRNGYQVIAVTATGRVVSGRTVLTRPQR